GGRAATGCAPRRARALEVHRPDPQESAPVQNRPDARQPRLPVYLQLLHRLGRPLSTAGPGRAAGGPAVSAAAAAPAARRLARSQFRRPDRKSTRLNSSHSQNLVCRLLLEKKKKKQKKHYETKRSCLTVS